LDILNNFNNLMMGLSVAMQPYNLMIAVIGLILGIIVGVLPGLGGANGCAILIPITFAMPPTAAVILLACVYWGALYGGSICSILFNIPGEPWAVAVTFDGYPMAKSGRAGKALVLSSLSHGVGAVFGVILLTFFAPIIAEFALKFGPPETAAVMILTFSAMTRLGGKSALKSLVAIFLGFILAAVGMDIVSGKLRMTYGTVPLMGGFSFIVAVIGLFGIGEMFLTVEEGLKMEGIKARVRLKDVWDALREMVRYRKILMMGSLIGCWLGVQPGGATPASFMAYGFAKSSAADKDQYGKGASSGIIAPEAAGHGAGTSATLPMITLGIPGSPTMAVIMGGLMIWGLQPGPMLFKEHADFVWGLIGSIWVANFLGLFLVLAFVPLFAAILRIKFSILMPVIIYVCAIGAYAVNNRMIDIYYMIIFGIVGFLFKKLDYPIAPMVLALVLGNMAETAVRQALIMGRGNPIIFFRPPIALPLVILALFLFFLPTLSKWKQRLSAKKET
jgi:putative tricarboxylic transport membrane protein